jgi:cytochrome b
MNQDLDSPDAGHTAPSATIRVWDPLVRIGHWLFVAAFFTAYFTDEDLLTAHVWAGYVVAAVVLVRIVWGFIGPEHARFSSFVRPPGAVIAYLSDAAQSRSKRYIGHNPAGGAMIVVILLSLAATAGTGMAVLADSRNAGPLVPWLGNQTAAGQPSAGMAPVAAKDDGGDGDDKGEARGGKGAAGGHDGEQESAYEDIHVFFANLTLALIVLHIGGVAFSSFSHRENLVRSMITGKKRVDPV